jgi:hypothetical protein
MVNVEKWPVVSSECLHKDTAYPRPGEVACKIIDEQFDSNNKKILTIDIAAIFSMETEKGQTQFDVYSDQIVDNGVN